MIFDVNDFDETAPGPWEWDLKRLAASFEIMGRTREFSAEHRRAVTLASHHGYRYRMRKSADSAVLTAWYDYIDAERIDEWIRDAAKAGGARQVERANEVISKARTRNSESVFAKLVRIVDGEPRITASPPLIVPIEDLLPPGRERESIDGEMRKLIAEYRTTLLAQHHPIADFTYQHMARKVVGVGSVGTRAWVVLLRGRDAHDPLLLQAKEAQASVLEPYVGASASRPRATRRHGSTDDAVQQRHLPRVAAHRRAGRRAARLLRAPIARLEGRRRCRHDPPAGALL